MAADLMASFSLGVLGVLTVEVSVEDPELVQVLMPVSLVTQQRKYINELP